MITIIQGLSIIMNEEKDQVEEKKEELKLFIVSHMGPYPCWSMEVATNAGKAFQRCRLSKRVPDESDKTSCKVEEVKIPGYRIHIIPEPE